MHWDDGTTGIADVSGKELFGYYKSITETDVAASKAACTNDREIQNAHALYKVIQIFLTGYIKNQMFSQISNVPIMDDGVSWSIHKTKLAMSSAIQISMSVFKHILIFNPKEYNYHITNINTQLNHLFFLDTTKTRVVSQE